MKFNPTEIYLIIAFGTAIGGIIRMWGILKEENKISTITEEASKHIGKVGVVLVILLVSVLLSILWPFTVSAWFYGFIKKKVNNK